MEDFSGLIWIIGIVIFIVGRINKAAKQQQQKTTGKPNTPHKSTIQSQLDRAMKQINDIKGMASEQFEQHSNPQNGNKPVHTQSQKTSAPTYRSSLEGHIVEGHKVEGYKMEGTQVEGHKVEGHQVEGLKRRHNTSKFNKNKIEYTESSMKRGYAGEGCDEHYDMEIAYTKSTGKKSKKQSLHFSDNPIVQGIVMSQIIERPRR